MDSRCGKSSLSLSDVFLTFHRLQDGSKLSEENVHTAKLMVALGRGEVLENVFNRDGLDKQLIRRWLLEGAPIPGETPDDEQVQIVSHEKFKFQF